MTSKSYLWLFRTGRDDIPIVLYDYQPTRAGEHPKRFFTGYQGYLQVMDIVIVVTIKYRMSPLWDVGRVPDVSLMNP